MPHLAPLTAPCALPLPRQIGLRLRLQRRALNISQADLARAANLTARRVSLCEQGLRPISSGELFNVACALRVPITYFYDTAPHIREIDALLEGNDVRRLETEKFVCAFYGMKDPEVRHTLLKLITAAARPKDGFE